ncbi:probable arabinosyltransferase ARAD1 [Nicotiana tomentosiformis]|uniref:probable arabinosyltransferase ARAD1 n=1 Tax=Nicotiana tomentosiformis TaxID=4098 RepID=UPI00051C8861|nr:probable arabinosyltransferase ARAD1 [Nicotiana tomentosiformis]
MVERNAHSMGIFGRKSLFCLFTVTSVLFMLSWSFVLRSAGRPHFVDLNILPNSKLLALADDGNSRSRIQRDGEVPILVDKNRAPKKYNLFKCNPSNQVLKVFMYDLPPQFHFELLGWKAEGKNSIWPNIRNKVPEYPGGLNLQHSIEYWLTLDLLYSEITDNLNGRSAIRVYNSSEADVIFVPFFSSISYNRFSRLKPHQKTSMNTLLQEKLVTFLTAQEEWKRSGGKDHIIVAHHPNSLLDARVKLWPAMFILSDFGRYPPSVANVEKDIIAPYKHVIRNYYNDTSGFDSRPILLYFQGAIYRKDGGFIRQELFYMLKDEKDVHFSFGSVQKDGIKQATEGMHSSKFCLNIAGDTPSSNRLFDAIASHCVPVIISDEIELPYEDILDYSEFCIFVRTSDALKEKFLINLIRSIKKEEWTKMWARLKEVENLFEYRYPSKDNDAVQMIWQAIARKVPAVNLKLHKSWRFYRTPWKERGLKSTLLPKTFW